MKSSQPVPGVVRVALAAVALILMLGSWWGVARLDDGLIVRQFTRDGLPVRFMRQAGTQGLPGIIVAHGFGGSRQLMLGYGLTFARSGYAVMLLDFSGHATNPKPFNFTGDRLQEDLDTAHQALISQPGVRSGKVALLGHSMGSGAVMQSGIDHPDRYAAVIAISPTGAEVTETVPPTLMLQAGSFEGRFLANAQDLLLRAGGPSDDFAAGGARRLAEIPNVEHISILFSRTSQRLALEWLNRSFGLENQPAFKDTRILLYGLHLLGWLMLVMTVGSMASVGAGRTIPQLKEVRQWLGLILSPIAATLLLALLATVADVATTLGMQVGGGLAIWFLLMGVIWLAAGTRLVRPVWSSVLWGGALFGVLWAALGLMAQYTWMQWFLIPSRLWRWPILALACLPWKLAAGHALQNAGGWRRAGLWAVQSALVLGALVATALWIPGMFVIILIAPVLPFVLGIEILVSRFVDQPWAYAIGSSIFIGWMMAAFFPIL